MFESKCSLFTLSAFLLLLWCEPLCASCPQGTCFYPISDSEFKVTQKIQAPYSQASMLFNSYKKLSNSMPGVTNTHIQRINQHQAYIDQIYHAGFTFGFNIKARLLAKKVRQNQYQYTLLKSDRINKLTGTLTLKKIDKMHTLFIHQINILPSVPFFLRSLFYTRFKNQLIVSARRVNKLIISINREKKR